ncbi:hypothetical protein CYLTODRAFT_191091 [Cylindrobasidium torrendii FP15055 ss-10]|uniref:Uncharacterized protein n=1 Tax=Cylindrobasidium torrendii FP15055 ss-10 TaxID=1314674 RepID=A0A0D7BTH1_9AGAR|nr:hypothetical protein CYLTODRAFT_191091 [Cylindrobasidium torrendii FP15055 ss-10]
MPPVANLASIHKLPKADKTALLASFVTEQKTNAQLYAEQGLAATSRSPLSHVSLHTAAPASVRPCGFDTPVLKVRHSKKNVPLRSPTKKRKQSLSLSKADDPPQAPQSSPMRPAPKRRKPPALPPAKKQKLKEVPDDDHAARLAKRAQRRKDTRAITRPIADEECNSDNAPNKTKGSSNKPRKKDKIPPGLALMHGFSAANVGKGRLTVRRVVWKNVADIR